MARIFESLNHYKGKQRFLWIEYTGEAGNAGKIVKQQYRAGDNSFLDIPAEDWEVLSRQEISRLLRKKH